MDDWTRVKISCTPEQVEQVPPPGLGGAPPHAADHRRKHEVVQGGHPVDEVEELEHDADVVPAEAGEPEARGVRLRRRSPRI